MPSASGDPRIKPMIADNLVEGAMLFFDKRAHAYCVVAPSMVVDVLADYDTARYETNYDTFVGVFDNVAHFTARDDASFLTRELGGNYAAATACYYRIEIDNTVSGSITFSATSGNTSVASNTITWSAGDTMSSIVALFTAKNTTYITFAALSDGKGVGLEIGGLGTNTLTVTGTPVGCEVIDCSALTFYRSENPGAPAVGGTFNPDTSWIFVNPETHNNFRGESASSILKNKGLVGADRACSAMSGYDYSYLCGVNFAKFRTWASVSGDDAYCSDGVNGSTNNSAFRIMRKSIFEASVVSTATGNALKMYEYYSHLLTDQSGEYAGLRQLYESRYGEMTSMYDAYLMSHMIDVAANSGITNSIRNKGKNQTEIKADCMNVNYNYTILPAYPPEYNAQQYGIEGSEGFAPGMYYNPEPGDDGLNLRDDIMPLINANITASGGGTQLTNSIYMGSSADCTAEYSWCFNGTYGCLDIHSRSGPYFRCRPSLALPLPS